MASTQPDFGSLSRLSYQDELVQLLGTLIDVMFCVKGPDGTYLEVNEAFVKRTGRATMRDVIGYTAHDIFGGDLALHYEEQDHQVFSTGDPLRDELELIRRPNGELGWYLTTKLPITDGDDATRVVGLASLSRDLKTPTTESIALESLQHVVAHVRDKIDQIIRVGDLAEAAGCSPDQLDRRMKSVFGLTPKQYLLRVRVDRAAQLLSDTDLSVATVAAMTGFYDQSDLTRRFSRLTNQTPGQFRSARSGPPKN